MGRQIRPPPEWDRPGRPQRGNPLGGVGWATRPRATGPGRSTASATRRTHFCAGKRREPRLHGRRRPQPACVFLKWDNWPGPRARAIGGLRPLSVQPSAARARWFLGRGSGVAPRVASATEAACVDERHGLDPEYTTSRSTAGRLAAQLAHGSVHRRRSPLTGIAVPAGSLLEPASSPAALTVGAIRRNKERFAGSSRTARRARRSTVASSRISSHPIACRARRTVRAAIAALTALPGRLRPRRTSRVRLLSSSSASRRCCLRRSRPRCCRALGNANLATTRTKRARASCGSHSPSPAGGEIVYGMASPGSERISALAHVRQRRRPCAGPTDIPASTSSARRVSGRFEARLLQLPPQQVSDLRRERPMARARPLIGYPGEHDGMDAQTWSKDGSRTRVHRHDSTTTTRSSSRMRPGGDPIQLTSGTNGSASPAWAPDGDDPCSRRSEIVPPGGTSYRPRPLSHERCRNRRDTSHGDGGPGRRSGRWAPLEERIAYSALDSTGRYRAAHHGQRRVGFVPRPDPAH